MRNNENRFGLVPTLGSQQEDSTTIISNSLNFMVSTEMVDLPSKGRFYPPSHPLHDKTSIEIKHMTAKEEDILSSKSLLQKGVALDKLIQSVVVDKSIPTDLLTLSDRNAILVNSRIIGYGPEYTVKFTCPSCAVELQHTFDLLEKVEVSEEEAEGQAIELDENCHFTIKLPKTGWQVKCRAMDGTDEKKLVQNSLNKKSKEFTTTEQLKMIIVSINGVTDTNMLNQAVEVMPAVDSKYLRNEYEKAIPPFSMKHNYKCKSCEHEEVVEVPLTQEFFWFK
jgi:hypothetical protein